MGQMKTHPRTMLLVPSFPLLHFFLDDDENVRVGGRITWDRGKLKNTNKQKTGTSSTYKRGARAAYRYEYPCHFGQRIAFELSFRYQLAPDTVSDPDRSGREKNVNH